MNIGDNIFSGYKRYLCEITFFYSALFNSLLKQDRRKMWKSIYKSTIINMLQSENKVSPIFKVPTSALLYAGKHRSITSLRPSSGYSLNYQ